jgi:RNA polymerase sigma-70 factor (ECF subfamily)
VATEELSLSRPVSGAQPLAWETVYREHVRSVAHWVRRLGGPVMDVEDCVHEVFLVVQAQLPDFRGDAKLASWLYRIAVNVVRHQRRKLKLRAWLAGSAEDVAGSIASRAPTPPEELEREQARRRLYQVLDSMSERYRSVFILFELEHLSGREIGEILGGKESTVWVWLHRARAQFMERMLELEEREPP